MRLLNNAGRLALQVEGGVRDVERASGGRFASDPQAVYARWDEFRRWVATLDLGNRNVAQPDSEPFAESVLGPPVPLPAQVFAVGLNYRAHAEEAGLDVPTEPFVFTNFPSSTSIDAQTARSFG